MTIKLLQRVVADFRNILKRRNYNWEINQLHTYFCFDQSCNLETIQKWWSQFMRNRTNTDAMDIYIHIPFCHSKCSFCPFQSWLYKNNKEVDAYIEYLIEEMKFFEKTFRKIRFQRLLIGGGTPNILNKQQLNKIFINLYNSFSFTKDARKTLECNPEIITEAYIHDLKRLGLNKINFGVQSLNSRPLKINKRNYQTYANVKNAIIFAKRQGFRYISIDLIVGLAGDSLNRFAKTFADIAKLKPANIIVHGLKPPSKKYLSDFLKMSGRQYYMDHYPRMIDAAFKIMRSLSKQYGYLYHPESLNPTRWQWGFVHKDYSDFLPDRVYTGEYTGCGSILGLGINARSHIFRVAEYRQIKQPRHFSPSEKIFEGKILEKKEEMIKFILNHLDRNSNIPRKIFKHLFNENIEEIFPYALYSLKLLKKICRVTDDLIIFSFHKPEEKYIYALFFFREAKLV